MTDSYYLAKGISAKVWRWNENGYRDAEGKRIENRWEWQELHDNIQYLEDIDVVVRFWLVNRKDIECAEALAEEVLEQALDPASDNVPVQDNTIYGSGNSMVKKEGEQMRNDATFDTFQHSVGCWSRNRSF